MPLRGIVLALVGLVGLSGGKVVAEDALKVGDAAPDFKLVGSDGNTYTLSQFKGKKHVVVAWFPKAFTGGCTAECKSLGANGKELRKFNVAYFAASCDDADTNKRFAESLGLDFPILSDPEKSVAKAYGVLSPRGFPSRWTFYIDKEGVVRHIDKEVKPASHGADVVKRLEALKFQD